LSFNACWTRFTSSLPAVAPLERDDDTPEVDVSEEEDIPEDSEEDIPDPLWVPLPVRLLPVP